MIEAQDLSRRYGERLAVNDVSFRVEAGELLALVGASGSGKTTTLKMINRLVAPSTGRVLVDGEDVATLETHQLRRRIGYVFQGVGLFPHMSVRENVAVPLRLAGWEGERARTRVTELLALVELDPRLAPRLPSELSGGQQQRVGVARALAVSPRLMLLDEPFGALDPLTRDRLQQSFLELRRRLDLTAVLVTHDMAEALLLADRVGVMNAGRLVQIGTPAELLRAPADDHVAMLLATPRRQARRLDQLLGGDAVRDQLALLPYLLGAHVRLTLAALLAGTAVAVPVGILVSRAPRLEGLVLGLAGVVQTVPALALLAVMVPLLSSVGLSGIGFLPAFLGLVLYSVLPILRNTVTGLAGIDPAVREAAEGVGMTSGQRLRMVELPLALPVILAGMRTATVWSVGMATLSTPVGAPSLGNFIFSGLQTRNYDAVLVGCAAAAVLALCLDGLLRLQARGYTERRPALVVAGGAIFVAISVASAAGLAPGGTARPLRIGAKTFTEQYVLAEVLARQIHRKTGAPAEVLASLGSTVAFDALARGEIDAYVEYTGTILSTLMHRTGAGAGREAVLAEVDRWLEETHGVGVACSLGFENTYAFALRRGLAFELGVRRLSDLAPKAARLRAASDYEFWSRNEWADVGRVYDLEFAEKRVMDPSLLYAAVAEGQVGVITAYFSDGRIAAYDLITLEDDRGAIPPYDAVVLVSRGLRTRRPDVVAALHALQGTIDIERMRAMNAAVDRDGKGPAAVAEEFLAR